MPDFQRLTKLIVKHAVAIPAIPVSSAGGGCLRSQALEDIEPITVAAYIETLQRQASARQ
jgi:hypothetical protein